MVDNKFMYILDLCQDLEDWELNSLKANIDIIIENRKEENNNE